MDNGKRHLLASSPHLHDQDQLGAGITTYNNTGLSASTAFDFRVRAYRSSDTSFSGYSNVASATTWMNAPSNLSATAVSPTQIDLVWSDNSPDETNFRVERSPNGTSSWSEIATVTANTTKYTNTGLVENSTYYYRVRAYRASDTSYSAYSNTANSMVSLLRVLSDFGKLRAKAL
jgi:hypothetical protein